MGGSNQKGFSLVELAISVTVIGLLIAAAVKSGEIIENASISSSVLQVKALEASVDSFRSEYKAWPGDFANAESYIDGCNSSEGCTNGDGNGAVLKSSTVTNPGLRASMIGDNETVYLWRHLVVSGNGSGVPSGSSNVYGSALPALNYGGGVEMYYDSSMSEVSAAIDAGHFFRIAGVTSSSDLTASQGVDGKFSYLLDVKMDDGSISAGDVFSVAADSSGTGTCTQDGSADCITFFRLRD